MQIFLYRPQWLITHRFGRNETCAMLLGLASGNIFLCDEDRWPLRSSRAARVSADAAALAKKLFCDLGERPINTERVVHPLSKMDTLYTLLTWIEGIVR